MKKTASEIADEVLAINDLEKVAALFKEALDKEAYGRLRIPTGIDIKIHHVWERESRLAIESAQKGLDAFAKWFRGMSRSNKLKTLPHDWYRPVSDKEGTTIGYIVGHGAKTSSLLGKEGDRLMKPFGTRI